ncbi:monocarboxylate transporter 12-B-like [Echeneis naucrates]|uniref:monocarboxylate transporter 12-B-like n=1 Tax=Echeneis naucrates TaxID=173247 RepID=UPI001113D623|nr:monocarboxylate transporter 12-B-like [Echeneis naucrates]
MAVTKEEKLQSGRRMSVIRVPPEGGWGWMIVAGCFLATICIRAVTRCVSIFFVAFQLHFEKDYSTTAWIHSLIDCTTMLCAPLASFLASRFTCRATVIAGGLLSATGLVLSSFASSLEYLYIFLGILTGLGFSLSYTPAIAMVGRYFSERKALAYGIALSGSGIGTFILAPAVQFLIEHYSWRGALLILGGFVSNLCACGALMRPLGPQVNQRLWENNMTHLEQHCQATVLDSEDTVKEAADCSQVEPKQLDTNNLKDIQGLLIANGALRDIGLSQGNIALLSRPADMKIAECILFSNKLTGSMLGQIKHSDLPTTGNDSMIESMKLVECMNSNNKAAVMIAESDDQGFPETKSTDACLSDKPVCPPPEASVSTKAFSSDRYFSLMSAEVFGFLLKPNFLILSVSFLFLAYGCSTPVVYLVPYALSVGVEHHHAAFLMSIFGVCGIVGNITFGWITDRKCLKKYRMMSYMVALGMEGLCCMLIPLLHSFSLLVAFSVLYGYFDGAYVALIPVVTSDVVGPTYLTSALGVVYFLHAIPYLVSPPIGGWLVDRTGNYAATFFLSGTTFILSSLILTATILSRRCQRSKSNSAKQDTI